MEMHLNIWTRGPLLPPALRARRAVSTARGATGAALLALALGAGTCDAALYKWVDEKGVTHYTDTMPPDAINKGNVELSKQGIPMHKTDPTLTPEQRKAAAAEAERKRAQAKQAEEEKRRDRALLDSYTVESDIDLAKTRSLRTIENALQSAQAYSNQLAKRKTELAATKASLGTKPVPTALERDIAATDAEITRQADLIARKKQELVTIAAKYDADKVRWQALRGEADAAEAAAAAAAPEPPPAKPAGGTPPRAATKR